MCTEGLLNAKLRVPTEYGFVRDRGVPKSFSLTVRQFDCKSDALIDFLLYYCALVPGLKEMTPAV